MLFQLWAFIVPGLTAREKKWSIPFVAASFLLFLAGAVTAFFVLPKSLQFLLGFAGEGVVPLLTVDRYVGFVTLVTLAFGVSFLFPVILVFLEAVGVLTPETLAGFRRYAIVVIAMIAAVITPGQDVFSMVAMMIPMYLFYEASYHHRPHHHEGPGDGLRWRSKAKASPRAGAWRRRRGEPRCPSPCPGTNGAGCR